MDIILEACGAARGPPAGRSGGCRTATCAKRLHPVCKLQLPFVIYPSSLTAANMFSLYNDYALEAKRKPSPKARM